MAEEDAKRPPYRVNSTAAKQVLAALTALESTEPLDDLVRPEWLIDDDLQEEAVRVMLYWLWETMSELAKKNEKQTIELIRELGLFVAQRTEGISK